MDIIFELKIALREKEMSDYIEELHRLKKNNADPKRQRHIKSKLKKLSQELLNIRRDYHVA